MSKFVDHVEIRVIAGTGGSGSRSMRREIYVPLGGPDGGDGGRGGSVLLVASDGLRTLVDFTFEKVFSAENGENGARQKMYGRYGKDKILKVPLGTLVRDAKTGEVLADMVEKGQIWTAAKGGRGGRGNVHFKTSTRQAPSIQEKGEPGEQRALLLEMKLLADAALVGLPNAGKSTLLSVVSAARPKVANYPFTTLEPQLGVVRMGEEESFVLADLPGLIEGASEGKGLGHRFLRHIERTRVLLYLLDGSVHGQPGEDGKKRDLWKEFQVLKKELKSYHPGLAKLPRLAAISKADLEEARAAFKKLKPKFQKDKTRVFLISAATGDGMQDLLKALYAKVREAPASVIAQEAAVEKQAVKVYRPEARFSLESDGEGRWLLEGREIRKWVAMTDFENEEAVDRLRRIFDRIGVAKALRTAGAAEGDSIRVGNEEFSYVP